MLSLHSHSNYSLLKGTIVIDKLLDFAEKAGSSYAALTDLNAMYGLIQFAKSASERNIKPILGVTLNDPENEKIEATILAKNNLGYSRICKLITTRKLKDDFSLTEIFKQELSDIFIITSSLELLKCLPDDPEVKKNVFAELIVTEAQRKNTRLLYDYCKSNTIQFCASHPSYFSDQDEYLLHKVVTAIRLNSTISQLVESDFVDKEYYLKSSAEMHEIFKTLPEALRNTQWIAENCNVDLKFGVYKFPQYPLPATETSFSYLWKICFKGLEDRYKPISDKAIKRLQYELEVIDDLGFSDYFLIVWDIVREAHQRNMVTIGRGSAANSLVAYCLGLTQVDPIEHNLYFERFLNRGRTSPPDVDLDFSWKERDAIVKYVFEKYGYEKVAMISTTVTFRARSAFRETAKVFGIPDHEISKFSKFIPWTSAKNLPDLASKFPESKQLKFDDENWRKIINIASKLASFPRHLSIHPGGIVITKGPITDYVAVEYAKNKGVGLIITQPDMYPIEDMGLIKIDLLSQRSLGVLRDTMNTLNRNENHNSDTTIFNIDK
jgi:DNA polymerase III alpha subunit